MLRWAVAANAAAVAARSRVASSLLGSIAAQHVALSAARWGFRRGVGAAVMNFGVGRVAVGVATTGATGLTVRHQLKSSREDRNFDDILASGQEVAWFNAAMQPLWEHLNTGVCQFIVNQLQPALQQSVPVVGGFLHFRRLTLGEVAPRLGPVTVSHSTDGVMINIGFVFEGDLAVDFSAGMGTIEIVDLSILGSVQVALRPLVDALNPLGGITISCFDRPNINLKVRSPALELVVPNLYDLMRKTVDDVVANAIVVPNGVAVPIPTDPITDLATLRCPLPKGILRLTLERAYCDAGTTNEVMSYVQMQLGAATWCSPVAKACGPRQVAWGSNTTQDFVIFSEHQTLSLELFHGGIVGRDSSLGYARVFVREIIEGFDVEIPLFLPVDGDDARSFKGRCNAGRQSGRNLHIRGEWLAVSDQPPICLPLPDEQEQKSRAGLPKKIQSVSDAAVFAPAGPGDAEVLASVRVDEITGLPSDSTYKYSARVVGAGRPTSTCALGGPPSAKEVMNDAAVIALARKLAQLSPPLPLIDVAEALGISAAHAEEFHDHLHRDKLKVPSDSENSLWDTAWCQRARGHARDIAASSNPQFGHIFHVPCRSTAKVELELLRYKNGSKECEVVASLSLPDLGALAALGGHIDGPFIMRLSERDDANAKGVSVGGHCLVRGSIRLRLLEKAQLQERDEEALASPARLDPYHILELHH